MNLPYWIDEALEQNMMLCVRKHQGIWRVWLQQGAHHYEANVKHPTLDEALEALDTLMLESANIKISR